MTGARATEPAQGRPDGAVCPAWCNDDHSPEYPVTDHWKSITAVPGTGNPNAFCKMDDGVKVPAIFVSLAASRGDVGPSALVTVTAPGSDDSAPERTAEIYLLPYQVRELLEALETAHSDLMEGGSFSFSSVTTEAGGD
jgi:hypothetical protein